jgi:hypothetical protein
MPWQHIKGFIHGLANERDEGWTDNRILVIKDMVKYFKGLHLDIALDVPDGTLPEDNIANDDDTDTDDDGQPALPGTSNSSSGMQLLNMLIHTFNGDNSYNIEVFLKDVSRACKRRNIKGIGKIEIAVGKLKEPALSQVRNMGISHLVSWKEFKAQMMELFVDVTDFPSLSLEISRCKQMENESVSAFSVRLFNLLLKKLKFCNYTDKETFKNNLNAEAIACFIGGLRDVEHSEIIRRSYPTEFKQAVRLAKLEEVASRTKNERTKPFFKQVKIAVQGEVPPRKEDYPQYDERRYSRPRDATPQRPVSPQGERREYNNRYYPQNDQRRSRDPQNYGSNRPNNNGYQRRERSQERYEPQRRRSLSYDGPRGPDKRYPTPCDCALCNDKFSPRFVFPRVNCWQCGNRGHVQRNCMHAKGAAEEAVRQKHEAREPIVRAINQNGGTNDSDQNLETALVHFPYSPRQAHIDNPEWQ